MIGCSKGALTHQSVIFLLRGFIYSENYKLEWNCNKEVEEIADDDIVSRVGVASVICSIHRATPWNERSKTRPVVDVTKLFMQEM